MLRKGEVCSCLIDDLRSVPNQQFTPGKKVIYVLRFKRLGTNEGRAGVHERFADGFGIGSIGLVAGAEKRLGSMGIDELYSMAKRRKRPHPMMGRAASFNTND